ncbi:MAG: histidine phosphatase family protein [archaeon]
MEIYLIRHAESEGNLMTGRVWGQSNHFKLTSLGKQQANSLAERLYGEKLYFDEIHSSTAVRTKATAQLATKYNLIRDINFTDDLLELNQGSWVGIDRTKIYTPEVVARINADPWNFRPPNGESLGDVAKRAFEYIKPIAEKNKDTRKKIAFFTHGLTIKSLITTILESSPALCWKIQIDNTSITQFKYTPNPGWHLQRVNDHAHIKELLNKPD